MSDVDELVARLRVTANYLRVTDTANIRGSDLRAVLDALIAERDARVKAERELTGVSNAIATTEFLDPPDGGDVPLAVQVRRMKRTLDATRSSLVTATEALRPLKSGGEWGAWLAWIVKGAPTREQGAAAAKAIVAMRRDVDAALSQIEAGTVEHPDSAKQECCGRFIFSDGEQVCCGEPVLLPAPAEHPDTVRLREAVKVIDDIANNSMFSSKDRIAKNARAFLANNGEHRG
jgi:hypothetical protein